MIRHSILFLFILTLTSACQKIFEKPKWNTDIVAPLIKTSLGIGNLMKDTSILRVDGDTVKIVSRQKLYDFNFDSLIKLEVKPFKKKVKLSTLKLSDQHIERSVTLGELARAMEASGNAMGRTILDFHGSYVPVTNIDNLTAGPLDVDINQFFEYAVMDSVAGGNMNIKIHNGLPLTIARLEFELKNKTLPGTAIAHEVFSNIAPGTLKEADVDLTDKTMEGNQVVNVLDMDIQGGFVQIDTNDAVTITLTISDISVIEAIAIFPAQNVVDEKYEESLQGMMDARLRLAIIDRGQVEAEAYSTSQDHVYFNYVIPNATLNVVDTFNMLATIRPAPPGGTRHEVFTADFSGYLLDLRGNPGPPSRDTSNTFYNKLLGSIEYTGRKVHLSLEDSIDIVVQLKEVVPYYVEGYLGRHVIDINGSSNFDAFKNIESGILNFEKATIALVLENGFGIDGELDLTVKSMNTRTTVEKTFNASSVLIDKATKIPHTPFVKEISLGKELLEVLPDKIDYNAKLTVNRTVFNPAAPHYTDFAFKTSQLNPYLNIEVPLSIMADQLVLVDTADFASENFQSSVKSGSFTVHIDNGFPLGGDLTLFFLDQGGTAIDSVVSSGSILPGVLDGQNRVIEKKASKVTFYVDENKMQNILRSRKVVFKVKFSTMGNTPGSFVTIFSDYQMDFKLVGDFNYTIE